MTGSAAAQCSADGLTKINALLVATKNFAVDEVFVLPDEDVGREAEIFDHYFAGADALMDDHEFTSDRFYIESVKDILYSAAQRFIAAAATAMWPNDKLMGARVMEMLRTGGAAPVGNDGVRVVSFVLPRMELFTISNIARLDLIVNGDDARSNIEVFQAFVEAVTQWVNGTEEGMGAWLDSSEDFNVGDLLGTMPDLSAFLPGVGILQYQGADIIFDSSVQYDTVLVNRHRVRG